MCIDQLEIHLWRIKETKPRKVKVEASAREMAYSSYWSIVQPDCFTSDPPSRPGRTQVAVSRPQVSEESLNLGSHYTLTLGWPSFAFTDTTIDTHGLNCGLWVVLWLPSWICANHLFLLSDSLSLPLWFIDHGYAIHAWMHEWMSGKLIRPLLGN